MAPVDPELEALLAEVRAGSPAAWERFVERYERLVYSVPRRMGFDEADSADIAQATWVLVHRYLEHLREPTALVAWLATTARREASRFGRGQGRRRDLELSSGERGEQRSPADPTEALERLEAVQLVREAIDELDERCAGLLRTIDLEGHSYAKAALLLGMPGGSVGPTRMRCLAKLLPALQARGLS